MKILFDLDPKQAAVVSGNDVWTYGDIDIEIKKRSIIFDSLHSSRDKILFLKRNDVSFICDYFACVEKDIPVILADYELRNEVAYILKECSATMICADLCDEEKWRQVLSDNQIDCNFCCANGSLWISVLVPQVSNKLLNKAYLIQYTSGSTGTVRGAVHTRETFSYMKKDFAKFIDMKVGEKFIASVSLSHGYGFTCILITCLCNGGVLYLVDGKSIPLILKTIETEKIHYLFSIPPIFQALCRYMKIRTFDLSSLKFCCSSAMKLNQDIADLFKETTGMFLNQEYGSAETSVVSVTRYTEETYNTQNLGVCIDSVNVEIATDGEILVYSDSMAIGYADGTCFEKPFSMGDIGSILKNGDLCVHGRKKRLIDVGGKKFFLDEIESILSKAPGHADSMVKSEDGILVAYVVLSQEAKIDSVIQYCVDNLAAFKQPKKYIVVDSLKRSSMGKVKFNQ